MKRLGTTELNVQVAKKILGWKNVHRDHKSGKPDEVLAKKPDKAGAAVFNSYQLVTAGRAKALGAPVHELGCHRR